MSLEDGTAIAAALHVVCAAAGVAQSGKKWRGFFAGDPPRPSCGNWMGVGNAVPVSTFSLCACIALQISPCKCRSFGEYYLRGSGQWKMSNLYRDVSLSLTKVHNLRHRRVRSRQSACQDVLGFLRF